MCGHADWTSGGSGNPRLRVKIVSDGGGHRAGVSVVIIKAVSLLTRECYRVICRQRGESGAILLLTKNIFSFNKYSFALKLSLKFALNSQHCLSPHRS